jgi:4-oxalocrotonate tautomerase
MPIVIANMIESRTVEQKRALVQRITDAVVETLVCRPEQVRVLLEEIRPMNWDIGGMFR